MKEGGRACHFPSSLHSQVQPHAFSLWNSRLKFTVRVSVSYGTTGPILSDLSAVDLDPLDLKEVLANGTGGLGQVEGQGQRGRGDAGGWVGGC